MRWGDPMGLGTGRGGAGRGLAMGEQRTEQVCGGKGRGEDSYTARMRILFDNRPLADVSSRSWIAVPGYARSQK